MWNGLQSFGGRLNPPTTTHRASEIPVQPCPGFEMGAGGRWSRPPQSRRVGNPPLLCPAHLPHYRTLPPPPKRKNANACGGSMSAVGGLPPLNKQPPPPQSLFTFTPAGHWVGKAFRAGAYISVPRAAVNGVRRARGLLWMLHHRHDEEKKTTPWWGWEFHRRSTGAGERLRGSGGQWRTRGRSGKSMTEQGSGLRAGGGAAGVVRRAGHTGGRSAAGRPRVGTPLLWRPGS